MVDTDTPKVIPFVDLPEGTVTFLFTDIERSTQHLARLRDKYAILLEGHHRILREAFVNFDGHEVDTQGDAFFVAFRRATQAVGAAVEAQRKLAEHAWPEGMAVRVRMGIHTGEPWNAEQGYIGMDVHRAARIAHIGHGGQVLLSETATALVRDELPRGVTTLDLGRHLLKDIHRPERIAQLVIEGLPAEFPSLTSLEVLPAESARQKRKIGACPFRGLSAFQEADAQFYFGRDAFVTELEQAVTAKKPLAVILGSSGSGKSSVIFAGLLPRLRKAGGYQIAIFRPGTQPFYSLSDAVIELLEPALSKMDHLSETGKLAEQLAYGREVHLVQVLERIRKDSPGTKVVLVIDQFEELYTLCADAEVQKAFIDELLLTVEANKSQRDELAIILLTMRADFMGQALLHRPFADALQDASMLLGPMNRQELHTAIEKPAELQGAAFEPGLVERILDDVGEKPGNLPLLEFTLTQLWERQNDGWLIHVDYEAMGGVEGALAAYADQVFTALDLSEQELARHAFVQLVQPGEGTEDTRRIATHEELGEGTWKLIQHLADKRLVVTGRDGQGRETAEVVHEALIQKWGRFREWMDINRGFRQWQERLRANLRQWQESGYDDGTLLAGAPLAVAGGWLAERATELSLAERDYIRSSQTRETKQQKEKQRRRQWAIAGLSIGLVIALTLAVVAVVFGKRANEYAERASQNQATAQSASILALNEADARGTQQAIAEAEKVNAIQEANSRATAEANALQQADLARARELSLAAINNLQVDPERSILLALQAVSIVKIMGDAIPIEIQDALHRAVQTSRLRLTLQGHTSDVWAVAYSPDGSQLATASDDGTAKIWDADTGQELYTLKGHRKPLSDIAYSPDGSRLATSDEDGVVILWSSNAGELLAKLTNHSGKVVKLAYSPDGKLIASASLDQTVRVWDAFTAEEIKILDISKSETPDVAFSPDSTRLLTVGGNIIWWDTKAWAKLLTFEGTAAAIHPDGTHLAIGKGDGSLLLVDTSTGEAQILFSGNLPEAAEDIVFSPDGSRLVGYGWQNAMVWEATTGQSFFRLSGMIGIKAVLSPDSSRLITSSQDGTAKVWDIATGQELFTLAGSGSIYDLALSPSCVNLLEWCGARLATASRDQTARIWDISPEGSSELLAVPGIGGYFSQDDTRLTTLERLDAKTMRFRIWDLSPEELGTVIYRYTANLPSPAVDGSVNPDGTQVAVLTADATFNIFDVENGAKMISFPIEKESVGLTINPDFTRFATGYSNIVNIWNISNGQKLLDLSDFPQDITARMYSPDGKYFAVAVNPDFPEIHLLDANTFREISAWQAHSFVITSLAFSRDGAWLLSTSMDMTAKVWQVPSGEELFTLKGHTATINKGIISNDNTFLATSSNDSTTRIWDALNGQILLTLPESFLLDFSHDSKYLASGSYMDGLVHIYILDIDELADLARSRLTRGLTPEECQTYLHMDSCPASP